MKVKNAPPNCLVKNAPSFNRKVHLGSSLNYVFMKLQFFHYCFE